MIKRRSLNRFYLKINKQNCKKIHWDSLGFILKINIHYINSKLSHFFLFFSNTKILILHDFYCSTILVSTRIKLFNKMLSFGKIKIKKIPFIKKKHRHLILEII